jgi:tripartite-type tricarboxylate transporter receptor subunit TctC
MRRKFLATAAAAALALFSGLPAQAQEYPSKPIRIIVPFAVGGIADTFARVIAQHLQETWGQTTVVENKGGAGGNIGADLVAKAAPDGYTLVMGNIGTHAINPFLMKNTPFDPIKDFTPIAHVLEAEGLLVVNPSVPVKTVPELIAYAKTHPLTYASGGVGTTSHLAGELFKSMAKVDIVHVPYKGNSPAITDVLGGQAHMVFATMPTVIQQVRAGKLRAIAVIGDTRSQAIPEVPTIGETLKGFAVSNWIGLFAPAGTSPAIVKKLDAEIQKVMSKPETQKRLADQGSRFIPGTPQSFAAFQKAESEKWAVAIREAGIKPE